MRLSMKATRGFTLIELLIVVAILGILAAVVIPNVGRFIGRGETEARKTEFQNVSAAVIALMTETGLTAIPNPVGSVSGTTCTGHTNDMAAYPDATATLASKQAQLGGTWVTPDKLGYLLFSHDNVGNTSAAALLNYVSFQNAKHYYTVKADGTVSQCNLGGTLYVD